MKNKLVTKQTHKKTKPKSTGRGSPVRTAHMNAYGYNCGTQYSTGQI